MFFQEKQIQSLSAEISSLKDSQNPDSSPQLNELLEENARLKYRINILKKVRDTAGGPGTVAPTGQNELLNQTLQMKDKN